jgi:hypothetical protein
MQTPMCSDCKASDPLFWGGPTVFKLLTVEEHGCELFQAVQRLDFEGIVAKRKVDSYTPKTVWYKIKNPAYSQSEGRGELFERRQRERSARAIQDSRTG